MTEKLAETTDSSRKSWIEFAESIEAGKSHTEIEADIREQYPQATSARSDHFTVIFSDPEALGTGKTGGGMNPVRLAEYLEGKRSVALTHMQLPGTNSPELLFIESVQDNDLPFPPEGRHIRSRSMTGDPIGDGNIVRLHPRNRITNINYTRTDDLHNISVHEAIGHGNIETQFRNGQLPIKFIREGLADYITHYCTGNNPHDVIGAYLVDTAYLAFEQARRKVKKGISERKKTDICVPFQKTDMSISGVFVLRQGETGFIRSEAQSRLDVYFRGASFVKYFIDTYGVDKFKAWLNNITRENCYETLTEITGKSLDEIETGWKESVLQDGHIVDNPHILGQEVETNLDPRQRQQKRQERETIQAIYEQYADPALADDLQRLHIRRTRRRTVLRAAAVTAVALPIVTIANPKIHSLLQDGKQKYARDTRAFERDHLLDVAPVVPNSRGWSVRYPSAQESQGYQSIPDTEADTTTVTTGHEIHLRTQTEGKGQGINTGIKIGYYERRSGDSTIRFDVNGDTAAPGFLQSLKGERPKHESDDRLLRINPTAAIPNPDTVVFESETGAEYPMNITVPEREEEHLSFRLTPLRQK